MTQKWVDENTEQETRKIKEWAKEKKGEIT